MTEPSREQFEATFSDELHTKAMWECWQESRKAMEAEQAQAVEPVATTMADHIKNECGYCDFHAVVPNGTKLFTHPAPSVTGERAKVGDSKFESWYSELNQAGKGSKQVAREAYEAGLNEAQQVAAPVGWTLTADKMPEPCMNVLAYTGKGQPIRAQWVPTKTLEASGDGDFGEYDEATDEIWWPEGWYETNAYEETHWLVDGQVTHWMSLPPPPQGDKP